MVEFARDVSACAYSATLAAVQNGPVLEQPPGGRIAVASGVGALITVKTFDAAGAPTPATLPSARRYAAHGLPVRQGGAATSPRVVGSRAVGPHRQPT